jgi:3-oxoacyl-[acyl-carrier protein] reductase
MERIVLVTGGSGGIGRAVAQRFRAGGDRVVVTGRDADRVAAAAVEIDAEPFVCDASDPLQVAALAAHLGGALDVLVNAAGGSSDFDRPEPISLSHVAAAWRANLDANLISAVLTTTAVKDRLRPGGTIINVGSIGAEYAGTSYGVSKAALQAWTAGLSAEVGAHGLTANAIAPGYIEGTNYFRDRLTEQRRDRLIAATHNGRPGRPEDVAETAYFLASAGARHITGQTLHLNGGAHTTR